jgi:AcrR family transcriptional regulator
MSPRKRTPKIFAWREPLLDALRLNPHISRACKAAGISRNSVYAHLRRDALFRRQWERTRDAAWEARSRQGWDSVMAELERRGWFARLGIAKPEYPSKQKLRQLARPGCVYRLPVIASVIRKRDEAIRQPVRHYKLC